MECPNCGKENPEGALFCIKCGANLLVACPKCGAGNPPGVRYCGKCGYNLLPGQPERPERPKRRWLRALLIVVGAVVILAALGFGLWFLGREMGWWPQPEPTASPTQTAEPTIPPEVTATLTPTAGVAPTATVTVTIESPVAAMEFATEPIPYPTVWPESLHYPESFVPVEVVSGTLTEGAQGWAAKLRFQDDPTSAADQLSSFFTDKGWQVVERTQLDSGGFLLLVQQPGKRNSGVAVIEPDRDKGGCKVLVTVFP